MWYYTDSKGYIMGYNPNNMKGNSGWVELSETIETYTNEQGIPIFKVEDSILKSLSSEEIERLSKGVVIE